MRKGVAPGIGATYTGAMRSPLLVVASALLVPACAEPGRYPSLLPRAAEKQSFAEPAAPPAAPVVADPALDAKIAAARQTLAGGGFEASAAAAERLARAAGGRAAGSDAWLDAQVALADLDARRSANLTALTDLEQLASTRATALAPPYPALDAAIAEGQATLAAQSARIAAIQALLPAE